MEYLPKPTCSVVGIDINAVEEKYNAIFVGDFCLKSKKFGWVNAPAAIFYQKVIPVVGYTHYFALFESEGKLLITAGESAITDPISAIRAADGEIIYSKYRHDNVTSKDGSCNIDGGREYCHWSATKGTQHVQLRVVKDKVEVHINEALDQPSHVVDMISITEWTDAPKWICDVTGTFTSKINVDINNADTSTLEQANSFISNYQYDHGTFYIVGTQADVDKLQSVNLSRDIRLLNI
jgi:hypothetical protein